MKIKIKEGQIHQIDREYIPFILLKLINKLRSFQIVKLILTTLSRILFKQKIIKQTSPIIVLV